jgi:hypothetical protein
MRFKSAAIASAVSGVVLELTGQYIAHHPIAPETGASQLRPVQWVHLCNGVHSVYGGVIGRSSFCNHAVTVLRQAVSLNAAGLLLLAGGVVLSITAVVRRSRERVALQQS